MQRKRMNRPSTNFPHLRVYDEQLVRLGMLAERYFVDDPNTSLIKLRQLTEVLAQFIATLMEKRLVVAESHRAPLRLGFPIPINVVERWFPRLYPIAT
jgi:hypothetical protein